MANTEVWVDCERGRALGCMTYCCRLLVRYDPETVVYAADGVTRKNCVDKSPETGLCVHLDPDSHRCGIWSERPSVCREYNCNESELLQIVLRDGCASIVKVCTSELDPDTPWTLVPLLDED